MKTIGVFYQGERIPEVDYLEADPDDSIATIKARIAEKHGSEREVLVFLEDDGEPVDESRSAGSIAGPGGLKVHLHRCRQIKVSVSFAGDTVTRNFGPGATVARVKRWAAQRKFGMTKEDASEHLLQITGTQERPSPGAHIGTLAVHPACRLSFDLVPDERVNG